MKIKSPWGSISRRDAASGPRYRLRGYIEGKQQQIGEFPSLDEAIAMAHEMREQLAGRPRGLTVGAWVSDWIDQRERAGRHRDTRETRAIIEKHILGSRLDGVLLKRLEARHIHAWLRDLSMERAARGKRAGQPIAENTLRNRLRALSAALSDAQQAGEIPANPALGIRVPKVAQHGEPWTWLTLDEIAAIEHAPIGTLPRKQRIAFTVAIYTGLREGELWGLHVEDIRLGSDPSIHVQRSYRSPTKSGRTRRIGLLPPAAAALEEWLTRDGVRRISGPVFFRGDDMPPITRDGAQRVGLGEQHRRGYDAGWGARWRQRLGIRPEVRFHDFRHTFASHAIQGSWGKRWSLEEVQAALGHSSRTTTERYAHLAPDHAANAAREARMEWHAPVSAEQTDSRTVFSKTKTRPRTEKESP